MITILNDAPAAAFGSFERPTFVGEIVTGGTRNESDFDDCFMQVIIGTHPDGYVVKSGDYLQYGIRATLSAVGTFRFGLDIKFVAGPWLSDLPSLDVASVIGPYGDRSPYEGEWYQVQESLEPYVGYVIDKLVAFSEEDDVGSYAFDLRQIVITNGDSVDKEFFVGLSTGLPASSLGLYVGGISSGYSFELQRDDPGPTYPIRSVTSGTTDSILSTDVVVRCSSSSNMTFNLPDATALPLGKVYIFTQLAAHNLVIDPYSTQAIDGTSTITLTQYQSVEIINLGSAWQHI